MPIVTKRDMKVVDFLGKFKVAKTSTLTMFYPSLLVTQKRLKVLHDNKMIKRTRDIITQEYIYYIKKPSQLRHCLFVTDFYRELNKIAQIELFEPEYAIGNLRSDGIIGYKINGTRRISFLEIQISNNSLDTNKYEYLYASGKWEEILNAWPSIIAVSNRRIPLTDMKVIKIKEDFSNINDLRRI